MEKLIKKVSSVLNITFKGIYASKAGVRFRNTQKSILVSSATYNNVFGLITDKTSDQEMKNISNSIANIANIGKLISTEMKATQVKPHGRWFITSSTIRTQVSKVVNGKNIIFNAIYSISTGKQIGELKRLLSFEVKPASIPALRIKTKEEQATASPKFDRDRFNKYVELVADFRKYYKVNANKIAKSKLNEKITQQFDLNNPKATLYIIIDEVRKMNGKEYKVTIESEVESIVNKVNKIKEERKESADAGSSLPKENKTELSMKGFELI